MLVKNRMEVLVTQSVPVPLKLLYKWGFLHQFTFPSNNVETFPQQDSPNINSKNLSRTHNYHLPQTEMPFQKRGKLYIGTNTNDAESLSISPLPPAVSLCSSKICRVTAPHADKAYTSTTRDLPTLIREIERKREKGRGDVDFLNEFYTVHWDHTNRPLPSPVRECVNKSCPVKARHEDKIYSKNSKKAKSLPLIIQEIEAEPTKTRDEVGLFGALLTHSGMSLAYSRDMSCN